MNAASQSAPRPINPSAFIGALVLAPLVLGAPCFALLWLAASLEIEVPALLIILAIPVFAVLFGALPYLLFGTPAFVIALRRGTSIPVAAFLANLVATPAVFMVFLIPQGGEDAAAVAGITLFFGSIAAPVWGGFFGWLYHAFAGDQADV